MDRVLKRTSTALTTRHLQELLPHFLEEVGKIFQDKSDLILACWPDVIGAKLAAMTRALSFQGGVLVVQVSGSTLYSLLTQYEKPRLLQRLRKRFPQTTIKTIVFRLG